jgi:RNA polymerase sigma-70 factor (ECF subfamily)
MPDADLSLLDRWCAGDATAGNELFKRHFTSIYRFFDRKTDGEIDDLVQETFLQCIKGRQAFQRQSSFRTYLFAIARHVLFGHWRARTSAPATLDFQEISIASLSTSVGSRIAQREDRARLLAVLRTLPLDQQILLEMFYLQDLQREQLAEIFDVEVATIGSRLFRARQALCKGLEASSQAEARITDDQLDAWVRTLSDDRPV